MNEIIGVSKITNDHPLISEIPELTPDKSRTKHDKVVNAVRNQKKITDNFNIEFNTGDFTGIKVPHKVYNELQVEAHKAKFDGVRVKDRRDISTHVSCMGQIHSFKVV